MFASVAPAHMLFGVLTNEHSFSVIHRSEKMFASALATVVLSFTWESRNPKNRTG